VFGRIYGGGLATISKQMGVPEYIGQQLLDAIDTLWPTLAQWSRDITNAVKAGLLTTWTTHSGRIIHLPVDKAYAAPNYIIQGTARELLMDALMRWRETRWGTAVMWPVHDEVDAHVPEAEAHDATAELVRCMETTLPSGVRIIAEPSEPSPFWQDAA
jgi:DNA polymerase-1